MIIMTKDQFDIEMGKVRAEMYRERDERDAREALWREIHELREEIFQLKAKLHMLPEPVNGETKMPVNVEEIR